MQTKLKILESGQVILETNNMQIKIRKPLRYKKKLCRWCKEEYTPMSPHQLYCCEDHAKYAKQECTRKRVEKYRRRWEELLKTRQVGTGSIGQHPSENWIKEYNTVRKELKRLGLSATE